jgi:hypothetical protein
MQAKAEVLFNQALQLDPLNPELQLRAVHFTSEKKIPLKEIAIFLLGVLITLILNNIFF